jgi:hypothetical protein
MYLNSPIEPESTDVLLWWKNKEPALPNLTKMAYEILSVPSTSVPSEVAFSKAGLIISKKRNRLSNKNIQACMCLSSWLKKSI